MRAKTGGLGSVGQVLVLLPIVLVRTRIVLKLQYYTRSMLKILPNFNHTTPKHNILTIFNFVVLTIILRGDIQRIKSVRSPVGSLLRPIAFDPWRVGYGRARRLLGIVVQPLNISKRARTTGRSWTPAEISAGISVGRSLLPKA